MDIVVISHFYNESLLLPYWLSHHTKIFDYGILIDYDSTDNSVEICEELAPNWEVRRSNNREFNAEQCDAEVMAIERSLGTNVWKVALNTTEFLMHPDLKAYANNYLASNPDSTGFRATGASMVESKATYDTPLDERPLIQQRHHGNINSNGPRNRLIHRASDGIYLVGRHQTLMENVHHAVGDIYCLWYGFSPYPQVAQRKLQIQDRIPQSDKDKGFGIEHLTTPTELDLRWAAMAENCQDLLDDPKFYSVWKETLNSLYGVIDDDIRRG